MGHKGTSHTDPHFVATFSNTIKQLRDVYLAPDGQPFVLAGSGTLGWDLIAANLIGPGELALIITTGYFGDRFGECVATYGAKVEYLKVDTPGDRPSIEQITQTVEKIKDQVKLVTLTHVDTSTGVLFDIKATAKAIRQVAPNALIAVDGVCAVGAEELRMTEWDIDAYLTGSQKALGVPPGLSISVIRPRALERLNQLIAQGVLPRSYYANMSKWLPIMNAYEEKRVSYFATPAVSLIYALNVSLGQLLSNGGMEQRFVEHTNTATEFRKNIRELGLNFVPLKEEYAAHTMSAIRYPAFKPGVGPAEFLAECKKAGLICAGGLHALIKDQYFRVGHMGVSSRNPSHIQQALSAIKAALVICTPQQASI